MNKVTINKDVKVVGKFSSGFETTANGQYSHAEGARTSSVGDFSHSEGYAEDFFDFNNLSWSGVVDETTYKAECASGFPFDYRYVIVHKEDTYSKILDYDFSGGVITIEVDNTLETAEQYIERHNITDSCAEFSDNVLDEVIFESVSYGKSSHREGNAYTTFGEGSHGEGSLTVANGDYSHAEGVSCISNGDYSHVEGKESVSNGDFSHSEGLSCVSNGNYSHAEGEGCKANGNAQHVSGKYNIEDNNNKYASIIGNGSADETSNAQTVDWSGNTWSQTDVACGGTSVSNAPYKLSDIHSVIDSDWGYVGSEVPEGFVDLGLSVYWAQCNLGASNQQDYGKYYAWGDTTGTTSSDVSGKFYKNWYGGLGLSAITSNLTSEYDAAYVVSSGAYRMPSETEVQELIDGTNYYSGTTDNINGMFFVSKTDERQKIFIPFVGMGNEGKMDGDGVGAMIWTSNIYDDDITYAKYGYILSMGYVMVVYGSRYYGFSIRPVCPK